MNDSIESVETELREGGPIKCGGATFNVAHLEVEHVMNDFITNEQRVSVVLVLVRPIPPEAHR